MICGDMNLYSFVASGPSTEWKKVFTFILWGSSIKLDNSYYNVNATTATKPILMIIITTILIKQDIQSFFRSLFGNVTLLHSLVCSMRIKRHIKRHIIISEISKTDEKPIKISHTHTHWEKRWRKNVRDCKHFSLSVSSMSLNDTYGHFAFVWRERNALAMFLYGFNVRTRCRCHSNT